MLIHISTGFLLYFFVKSTFCTPVLRSKYANYMWISFFTAAVWMMHPLQTQSVSYIVQRMNSMAAMFYLLSILLYALFRLSRQHRSKWWLFSGCVMAAILSLASKEIAVTLPVFIIAYEWYFFQDLNMKWLKKQIPLLAGCLLLIAVITLIFLGSKPLDSILGGYNTRNFTLTQRLLTQPRVVIFYLSQLLWPHPSRLNLDHDFALSNSLMDPITTLFSIIAIAALIILAVVKAKKQRLWSFCIFWFFGNLVIESSIIPLEIIFEHRVYLPSMTFSLTVALVAYRWVKPAWLQAVLLGIMVTVGAFWTYERNSVYVDRIAIWQDSVNKSPRKARPHNNLGVALADQGFHTEAIKKYRKALQIDPHYPDPVANIGSSLAEQGKIEESITQFREALEINPKDQKALNNLGASLILMKKYAKAAQVLSEAVALYPYYAQGHNNLGVALQHQKKIEKAIHHFSTAVQLDPEYALAFNNLGSILASQGKFEAAQHYFKKALSIDPNFARARKNYMDNQKNLN
jgi:tetratricopeptide (TPR) repeat protein